jgi:hypothetical protein
VNITEIWSRLTPEALTAADLCGDGVVLGDAGGLVIFLDAGGKVLAEMQFPAPIRDLAASNDGRAVAVAGGNGEVAFLADRKILWRKTLEHPAELVECGAEGDYVLALSRSGWGAFLNRFGRIMSDIDLGGPADSAALVRDSGKIVAVTREGMVRTFTSWGKGIYETRLHHSAEGVDASDSGDIIVIPVTAYGVEALTIGGETIGAYEVGEPVKAAAVSGRGDLLLFATTRDRLVLLDRDATVLGSTLFPAPITALALSQDGSRALVTTGCGYAHLLVISDQESAPLIELGEGAASAANPRPVFTKQVFSPFSMLMQARAEFSPDSSSLVIAGDRQRVQVFDLEGTEIARRRFGGSLLALSPGDDGNVRVFATRSVFTFHPDVPGTRMEWAEPVEIERVIPTGTDSAIALTDDAEVVSFTEVGKPPARLFFLKSPDCADIAAVGTTVAALMKDCEVVIYDYSGQVIGRSGPWPVRPRLLASGESGYLVGVEKLILLLGHDGEERWRTHLPAGSRAGECLPGTFIVVDAAGGVHAVTRQGTVHPVFNAPGARVVPFIDAGEGPGFLLVEGGLLTAVHPDGTARWRYRARDDIACIRPAPDGRHLAVMAGIDLHLFPLVGEMSTPAVNVGRTNYLEFADG